MAQKNRKKRRRRIGTSQTDISELTMMFWNLYELKMMLSVKREEKSTGEVVTWQSFVVVVVVASLQLGDSRV